MATLASCAHLMNESEAYESFDAASRYFLNISAAEFVMRHKNGDFKPPDHFPGVVEVLMLAPDSIDLD